MMLGGPGGPLGPPRDPVSCYRRGDGCVQFYAYGGLAWSPETARLAREHNNAQLIGLGGRMHSEEEALAIVDAFLDQDW